MKRSKIYEKIVDDMPENLNDLEVAAYINLKMAELKDFSERYYFGTKAVRNRIYTLACDDKKCKMQEKTQIICVSACKLYEYLCNKYGIETYYQGDSGNNTKNDFSVFEKGEHIFSVVKLKDGRHIKVDTEWELESIKTGLSWTKFGTKETHEQNLSQLSQQEIDGVMKKIGYINNKGDYLENYCENLYTSKLYGKSLKEKLEIIFNDKELLKRASKLKGSVEVYRFYRLMFKKLTMDSKVDKKSNVYNKKIYLFGANIRNMNGQRNYSVCTYMNDYENETHSIWLYSSKHQKMYEISPRDYYHFRERKKLKLFPGKNQNVLNDLDDYVNYIVVNNLNTSYKNSTNLVTSFDSAR